MNKLHLISFKHLSWICCLLALTSYGQKQTKTYNESFKVGSATVLEINTSHTDIEFETWDRDEVVIEASIELEGATKEEADEYFERNGMTIMGNSERIEISSKSGNSWLHIANAGHFDFNDIEIEIPEIPDIEPILRELEIPELAPIPELAELPPMPPLPPMNFAEFDYEAYRKDGEKYMKKWQKEFEKEFAREFDKEYEEQLEKWAEEMAARAERYAERAEARADRMEAREEAMKARIKEREDRMRTARLAMEESRKVRREELMKRREDLMEARKSRDEKESIFYFKSDGESKNYKIKKTIKVKMPKSVKLKLNVRHGEVKLAGLSIDVKASLSYASLLANAIDGKETFIEASYSPIQVDQWILGKLDSQYSEEVILHNVTDILLTTTSSDIVIDRILKKAQIENNLGTLHIGEVGNSFKSLDVTVKNGEVYCTLPSAPFAITVDTNNSRFTPPKTLVWAKKEKGGGMHYSGYLGNASAPGKIKIHSLLSEVVLQ